MPQRIRIAPVLAALEGRPVFNEIALCHALDEFERIKGSDAGQVRFFDLRGKLRTYPYESVSGFDLCLRFFDLQQLAADSFNDCPYGISNGRLPPHDCDGIEELEGHLEEWETFWEGSKFRKDLIAHLSGYAKDLKKVTRIVCFGLGRILPRRHGYPGACYIQHLAACAIRDVLMREEHHGDGIDKKKLEIFVQDPDYCDTCKKILVDRLGVNVVDGDSGFLEVNENTFVISVSPNICVRQIVTGITFDKGGPAAMLCDEINNDGMEHEGVEVTGDFAPYTTDPSAPWVAEYKARCISYLLNDISEGKNMVFGALGLYMKQTS